MTTIIRPAEEGDIPSINALSNWAIRETVAHFALREDPDEVMLRLFRGTRDMHPWLVALDSSGAFLGYARSGQWKTREAYDWTVEISVYVLVNHHAKGVGRALYERLFAVLRTQGYRTLLAGITLPNEPSVRLHESMGMRKVGEFPRVGFKFGSWHAVGYWSIEFDDGPPGRILSVPEALAQSFG